MPHTLTASRTKWISSKTTTGGQRFWCIAERIVRTDPLVGLYKKRAVYWVILFGFLTRYTCFRHTSTGFLCKAHGSDQGV